MRNRHAPLPFLITDISRLYNQPRIRTRRSPLTQRTGIDHQDAFHNLDEF